MNFLDAAVLALATTLVMIAFVMRTDMQKSRVRVKSKSKKQF